jgi:hypothetical protein
MTTGEITARHLVVKREKVMVGVLVFFSARKCTLLQFPAKNFDQLRYFFAETPRDTIMLAPGLR